MKAVIYSTPTCPYCTKAKTLLKSKNIPYTEFTVGVNATKPEIELKISALTGSETKIRTVPQIFITDDGTEKYVGGFDQLSKFLT